MLERKLLSLIPFSLEVLCRERSSYSAEIAIEQLIPKTYVNVHAKSIPLCLNCTGELDGDVRNRARDRRTGRHGDSVSGRRGDERTGRWRDRAKGRRGDGGKERWGEI